MEITKFVINNWYLFLALIVVLALLVAGPLRQIMHRVRSVGPSEAVLLINRENAVVVDVRDSKEFQGGHIAQATNVPLGELKARLRDLEKFKQRPLIISAQMIERALKAAILLRKQGFENVSVLAGGIGAWERSQLPMTK